MRGSMILKKPIITAGSTMRAMSEGWGRLGKTLLAEPRGRFLALSTLALR